MKIKLPDFYVRIAGTLYAVKKTEDRNGVTWYYLFLYGPISSQDPRIEEIIDNRSK